MISSPSAIKQAFPIKILHKQPANKSIEERPSLKSLPIDTISFTSLPYEKALNNATKAIRLQLENQFGATHPIFIKNPESAIKEKYKQTDYSKVYTTSFNQEIDNITTLVMDKYATELESCLTPCTQSSLEEIAHNFGLRGLNGSDFTPLFEKYYPNIQHPEKLPQGQLSGDFRHCTKSKTALDSILKNNFVIHAGKPYLKLFGNGIYFNNKLENPRFMELTSDELHSIDAHIEAHNPCFINNKQNSWNRIRGDIAIDIGNTDSLQGASEDLSALITSEVIRKIFLKKGYDAVIAPGEILIPDNKVITNLKHAGSLYNE